MLISKPNFEYSQAAFRLLPHPKIKRHDVMRFTGRLWTLLHNQWRMPPFRVQALVRLLTIRSNGHFSSFKALGDFT
jgi:hypothetical protein